jgi:hypothetical protein
MILQARAVQLLSNIDTSPGDPTNMSLNGRAGRYHLCHPGCARTADDAVSKTRDTRRLRAREPNRKPLGAGEPSVTRIAAEELVRPLPADGDGDVFASEFSQRAERDERFIGKRLPERADEVGYALGDIAFAKNKLVVLRPNQRR